MQKFHDRGAGPKALIILATMFAAVAASAGALTLEDAQRIAIARDAGRQAIEAESAAMRDMAVAAGQLPDPEARLGAINVPTDSFAFDAEEMTMLEFGFMQRFPAGKSRSLARAGLQQRSLAGDATALDRARKVRLAVARAWHELDYLDAALEILGAERRWAEALVAGILSDYAAGEGAQTELLDARLMVLEIDERAIALGQQREVMTAELLRWVGDAAGEGRAGAAPGPHRAASVEGLVERLTGHPRLAAMDFETAASESDADLAAQRYKPSFGLDLSYGLRQGRGMANAARPDMLSAMLVFDVPLFTRDRQDREVAAARSRTRAATARRADEQRELEGQLRAAHARAARLEEMLALYESQLQRVAEVSVDAALSAYRASNGSLADLINTERRLLAIRDRLARTRADLAQAHADINYLAGEQS